MLTIKEIKVKYGHVCSFAIWKKIDKTQKPKYGVGDISHFDNEEKININRNIILTGLNKSFSKNIVKPFQNFHSTSNNSNDFRIRYAVNENPIFRGAYMTDIIKDHPEVKSDKVMKYLNSNKDVINKNIKLFEEELKDIGAENPVIIAFGNACYKILNDSLGKKYKIIKVPHYSSGISRKKLRECFNEIAKCL